MTRNRASARRLPFWLALASALGASASPPASAASDAPAYPTRPVRIIVPFTPGGSTDLYARTLVRILKTPEVSDKLTSEGGEVTPTTPGEAATFIKSIAKWAKVLKDANIPLE